MKNKRHNAPMMFINLHVFTARNNNKQDAFWVPFMKVDISELEKGNGELYMVRGNLNITMVYLRFS